MIKKRAKISITILFSLLLILFTVGVVQSILLQNKINQLNDLKQEQTLTEEQKSFLTNPDYLAEVERQKSSQE